MHRRHLLKTLPAAAFAAATPLSTAPLSAATPRTGNGSGARIRSALCAYSYRDALAKGEMTYEDLVDICVENDIDGLDLTVYWLPKTGLDEALMSLRRKAYLAAVEIPAIAIRSNLCKPDVRDREIEVAWLSYWVDIAHKLGAGHIRVFGGRVPEGHTEDQAAEWVVEILKRAAEYAGKKGVILGLENHGGITLYAKRVVQMVKAVDNPWVGINLDTGNFHTDPYNQIKMCVPYAVNSQAKTEIRFEDGHFEPCDWDRVVKMFGDAGYRGYISLEYSAKEPAKTAVPKHLKRLHALTRKYSA